MTDKQKAVMEQALDALTEFTSSMTVGQRYTNAGQMALDALQALREALVEPGTFIQKGYKIVPIKPPEEALEVARRAYRNASVYDVAHVWHAIITALPASPPAEVPLLTDEQILNCNVKEQLWFAARFGPASSDMSNEHIRTHPDFSCHLVNFARAVEQAVRQKAGIK